MEDTKRTTVQFTERATKALLLARELTGDNLTDTINRAVQLYSYIMFETYEGAELILKDKDGNHSIMKIL